MMMMIFIVLTTVRNRGYVVDTTDAATADDCLYTVYKLDFNSKLYLVLRVT